MDIVNRPSCVWKLHIFYFSRIVLFSFPSLTLHARDLLFTTPLQVVLCLLHFSQCSHINVPNSLSLPLPSPTGFCCCFVVVVLGFVGILFLRQGFFVQQLWLFWSSLYRQTGLELKRSICLSLPSLVKACMHHHCPAWICSL